MIVLKIVFQEHPLLMRGRHFVISRFYSTLVDAVCDLQVKEICDRPDVRLIAVTKHNREGLVRALTKDLKDIFSERKIPTRQSS